MIVYCFSLLSQMKDCEQLNVQHSDSIRVQDNSKGMYYSYIYRMYSHCLKCVYSMYVCTYVYRVPISVLLCVMCY